MQRKNEIRLPKRIFSAELPGRRGQRMPRRRFRDSVREDDLPNELNWVEGTKDLAHNQGYMILQRS